MELGARRICFSEIEDFLARGGRLVITFYPQTEAAYFSFQR